MICENNYCIYWNENDCILVEIYLNNLGICESCINISIPDEVLAKLREEQLAKIDNMNADI